MIRWRQKKFELEEPVMKRSRILLLFVGLSGFALMGDPIGRVAVQTPTSTPEMNPGSALSALTLLSGALVVIRSRRKR
jgi:hypothetical protein